MESRDTGFIYELKHYRRNTILITLIFIALLLVILTLQGGSFFFSYLKTLPFIGQAASLVEADITNLTPLGVFYITFLGDLFFNPIPPELIFFTALVKGNYFFSYFFVALAGIFLAHVVNYAIGRRFSIFFMYFVSKKSLYKARRKINKYGGYAVLIFTILPLPAPLLTFALGITRYNKYRLFSFLMIGSVIKYIALMLIFKLFGNIPIPFF